MSKKAVNKVSGILANVADKMVLQSGCCTFWGEVKLPDCMRNLDEPKKKLKKNK